MATDAVVGENRTSRKSHVLVVGTDEIDSVIDSINSYRSSVLPGIEVVEIG